MCRISVNDIELSHSRHISMVCQNRVLHLPSSNPFELRNNVMIVEECKCLVRHEFILWSVHLN